MRPGTKLIMAKALIASHSGPTQRLKEPLALVRTILVPLTAPVRSTSLESYDDCSASDDMPIDAHLPEAEYDLGWETTYPPTKCNVSPSRGHRDAGTRDGASSDGDDGGNHARLAFDDDPAAAWNSWVTSLSSGAKKPRHLTKRLRTARRAYRAVISAAPQKCVALSAGLAAPRGSTKCPGRGRAGGDAPGGPDAVEAAEW